MSRRFQFSLRVLLVAVFSIAVVAIPVGYFIRLPPAPRPPIMVPTNGIVTLDGAPLADAMIAFYADGQGRSAGTDAAGSFALLAFPGSYKVAVIKTIETGPRRNAVTGELIDPNEDFRGFRAIRVETKSLIPECYGNPHTSGLTADVCTGGPNRFMFQLVTP
ncbi:MAG TPA: hypothetical protein VG826_30300 [Pirellulales bacterium]|nr:hypothetical protein [Pirellulales bacterium]